jgi:hypothetical protein
MGGLVTGGSGTTGSSDSGVAGTSSGSGTGTASTTLLRRRLNLRYHGNFLNDFRGGSVLALDSRLLLSRGLCGFRTNLERFR